MKPDNEETDMRIEDIPEGVKIEDVPEGVTFQDIAEGVTWDDLTAELVAGLAHDEETEDA